MHHRRAIWTALLLTGALVAFHAGAWKDPRVDSGTLRFSLPDLDGNMVSSSDPRFAGKVVVVDIWGTWCPPCRSESPVFAEMQERYGDLGLEVVGIAFEREGEARERRETLRQAIEEDGINYLILDGGTPDRVASALPDIQDFDGFPVEILIGRDGRVRSIRNGFGYSKKWARRLENDIVDLLAEETPAGEVEAGR